MIDAVRQAEAEVVAMDADRLECDLVELPINQETAARVVLLSTESQAGSCA